jgi:hypothetical protein
MEKNKLSDIITALKQSKSIYLDVFDKQTNDLVMKLCLDVEEDALINLLDNLFDSGFYVKRIDKKNYDAFETDRMYNFNL